MDEANPHTAQARKTDWDIWELRPAKEAHSDEALLSFPVSGIPEDWGRVLFDWNNFEKDYKDPYQGIDFTKLHDLYLQVDCSFLLMISRRILRRKRRKICSLLRLRR